jgi:hypothetical protein
MKIGFSTVLDWNDAANTPIASTDLATATYTVFIDTVNPPVKNYPVPATVIAAGTPNADGSKHVTVDAVTDLGLTLVPNATYYVAAEDSVDAKLSQETAILTFVNTVQPKPPGNFTVG